MKKKKVRCPNCGSYNVKILRLPVGDEEFIGCEDCGKISVLIKVKVDEKENN